MIDSASKSNRASDVIERQIHRMIITLELAPGMMVSEAELMQRLKCGRPPLREALQRLTQEYLIISVPRKGVYIAELNLPDYFQLIEAVAHLESLAASLAAERATETEIGELEKIIEATAKASDADNILEIVEQDYNFHQKMARYGRNRYILDMTARLHHLTSRFIYLAMKNGLKTGVSLDEHREIVDAIRARDKETAGKCTYTHTIHAKERIIAKL